MSASSGSPSPRPLAPDVLFSVGQIAARVDALAEEIADHPTFHEGARGHGAVLAICALRGAFVFAADLLRALSGRGIDPEIAFMQVSSYGPGTRPTSPVRLVQDLQVGVDGRPVLLIDDILDTGHTLDFLASHLRQRGASALTSVVLLDKADRREVAARADFVGFACPDVFVVGYGMDADGRYRGLPYIGVLPGESLD